MAYVKFDRSRPPHSHIKRAVSATAKLSKLTLRWVATALLGLVGAPFILLFTAALMFSDGYPGMEDD